MDKANLILTRIAAIKRNTPTPDARKAAITAMENEFGADAVRSVVVKLSQIAKDGLHPFKSGCGHWFAVPAGDKNGRWVPLDDGCGTRALLDIFHI